MPNYFGGYQQQYAPQYTQGYPQQMYAQQRMDYLQSVQQPQQAQSIQQPGDLQARIVTSREEAVASQVLLDGRPYLFYNPNRQEVYIKRVDPQTGAADFMDMVRVAAPQAVQAQPVQYATIADIDAIREELESLRGMIPSPRRQRGAEAE